MTKVITYGTFDLLHYGHIRLLERAKALGDYLVVGITSDDYDKTRGKINNQQSLIERIAAVKATGIADEIIVEEYEGQKIDDIRRLDIDIFTVGSDWVGYFDYLNEYCKVIYLPRTEGVSSTEIRTARRKLRVGIVGDLSIAEKFKKECSYVNGVELIEQMSSYEDVDAVYVVSRPEQHYMHAKEALLAGKHVLCQSPVGISSEEYSELSALARDHNLILMDGIKTAYATAFSRLIVLVKSGKIGDVVSVDATCTSMIASEDDVAGIQQSKINSICAWGPIAMLPVFQILGTDYREKRIVSRILDQERFYDGFTKIDFVYPNAVASVKVAKTAKSEGELIVTGTKGYIYVPAPWWKTDYFEVRYEDPNNNRRYFYQLDGEGIRYEIIAFLSAVQSGKNKSMISSKESLAIASVIEDYFKGNFTRI